MLQLCEVREGKRAAVVARDDFTEGERVVWTVNKNNTSKLWDQALLCGNRYLNEGGWMACILHPILDLFKCHHHHYQPIAVHCWT